MNLGQWILFEERLRQAPDLKTLQMIVVNLLSEALPYSQAILFEHSHLQYKTRAASNISEINEYSAIIHWLNTQFYPALSAQYSKPTIFELSSLDINIDPYYESMSHGLYLPLHSKSIGEWGLVLWFKEVPAQEFLDFSPVVVSAISYSWEKLTLKKHKHQHLRAATISKKNVFIALAIVLVLFFGVRIKENTIATAEISPEDPLLIAPAINSSISVMAVKPNETVKAGQLLLKLDDITVKNQLEEAQQDLNIAQQRYLKAYRHSYTDEESKQEIQNLQNEQQQALVAYQYHQQLFERTEIKSPADGVVLYSDPNEWLGKPVKIGEKIMLLANPEKKEIDLWVAMDNMINIDKTAPAYFYGNENPIQSVRAQIKYINPIAEARPDGTLAYFGVAILPKDSPASLGEQGTMKLFGKRVSLAYYLLRKPMRYIRQHLGI